MHDWDGFRATMTEEWILYPPDEQLVWRHLQALCRLDHALVVDGSLTAEGLFERLRGVVPVADSVVYDLRELLDFLTRLDEEQGEHPFETAPPGAYRQRVCEALALSNETFTWRLSTNRNAFVPSFPVGEPPIVPMLLAS